MLINNFKFSFYVLAISILNILLFHIPFFKFVLSNIDYSTFNGSLLVISLFIMTIVANFFAFYILLFRSGIVGRILIGIFVVINAVALYFGESARRENFSLYGYPK